MNWKRKALLIGTIMTVAIAFAGCGKTADVSSASDPQRRTGTGAADRMASEPSTDSRQKGVDFEDSNEQSSIAQTGLQPVYFDFDQSSLRADARAALRSNAQWLKANPKTKVTIEGNCDERGTVEYNQALGQRRALVAKQYLQDLGVSPDRMKLISYGKENPVCHDSLESCWQQNRRAELVAMRN